MSYIREYGMFVDYSIHFSIQQCLLNSMKSTDNLRNSSSRFFFDLYVYLFSLDTQFIFLIFI